LRERWIRGDKNKADDTRDRDKASHMVTLILQKFEAVWEDAFYRDQ
jgi:hypothetical protein